MTISCEVVFILLSHFLNQSVDCIKYSLCNGTFQSLLIKYITKLAYSGDLPDDLHPRTMCEMSNKETLVFGGMYSEFSTYSNWSKSAFTFKEKKFICIEQGYMYNKAVINGAPVAAQQIHCLTDPREIKRLGSAITVSDRQQWDAIKGNLML